MVAVFIRGANSPLKKAAPLRDGASRLLRVSGNSLYDNRKTVRAEERRRRVSKHVLSHVEGHDRLLNGELTELGQNVLAEQLDRFHDLFMRNLEGVYQAEQDVDSGSLVALCRFDAVVRIAHDC